MCIIKTYFIIKLYANCCANKSAEILLGSIKNWRPEFGIIDPEDGNAFPRFKNNSDEIHCKNNGVYNIINISHQNIIFFIKYSTIHDSY